MKSYYFRIIIKTFVPLTIILAWQLLYMYHCFPPSQSSSPQRIISTIGRLILHQGFITNLYFSFSRLIIGVLIGSALGISLGILTSTTEIVKNLLNPTIQFLSGIPVVVWIPFWIMVLGINESFKIGILSISTFFIVYGSTFQSIVSIDKEYLDIVKLYKKTMVEKIKYLYGPFSQYSILGSIRLSLIIGWIVLFFVEYSIASEGEEGLGWFIANARGVGRVDEEFAGLIILGIIAYITDKLIGIIQNKTIQWKK